MGIMGLFMKIETAHDRLSSIWYCMIDYNYLIGYHVISHSQLLSNGSNRIGMQYLLAQE